MPIRGTFLLPSTVTKTLVCIDTIDSAEFGGRFYNRYLKHCAEFQGAFDFIQKMDSMFDYFEFPHSFFQYREFCSEKHPSLQKPSTLNLKCYHNENIFTEHKGAKMTFLIQVVTRQNATWQGMIFWVEQNHSYQFQSITELVGFLVETLFKTNTEVRLFDWNSNG